jgi:hypothetical protein
MRNLNPLSIADITEIPDMALESALYARLRDAQYLLAELGRRKIPFAYQSRGSGHVDRDNYEFDISMITPRVNCS